MHPGRPWVQINCTCWLPLTACINGNMLFGKCVPGLPLQALNATGSIYFLHVIMTYIGSMCAWLALQALDSIEADSELRVMDLIYILGAQIKPSPQFFAPKLDASKYQQGCQGVMKGLSPGLFSHFYASK
eukprot:scaffold95216_cov18-Tisochrysis_lutea.AAC.1